MSSVNRLISKFDKYSNVKKDELGNFILLKGGKYKDLSFRSKYYVNKYFNLSLEDREVINNHIKSSFGMMIGGNRFAIMSNSDLDNVLVVKDGINGLLLEGLYSFEKGEGDSIKNLDKLVQARDMAIDSFNEGKGSFIL